MKLWQLIPYSHVKFRLDPDGEIYEFNRIDGMFSKCYNEAGKLVHIMANTDVEVVE